MALCCVLSAIKNIVLDKMLMYFPHLNFCQFWKATRHLCSSQGRSMVRMLISSFPSQSSAASGPSQTPQIVLDGLGGQSVLY